MKWSITQMLEKPAASAAVATAARRGAISAGPPPQVYDGIWRPNRSGIGSSRWRAAASETPTSAGATIVTGPASWTPSKPSAATAVRASSKARS